MYAFLYIMAQIFFGLDVTSITSWNSINGDIMKQYLVQYSVFQSKEIGLSNKSLKDMNLKSSDIQHFYIVILKRIFRIKEISLRKSKDHVA